MRVLCIFAVVVVACAQATVGTPSRSFDRPSDVALTCASYDAVAHRFSALPLADCRPDSKGNDRELFGLVSNSARGEVALVDIGAGVLVDLSRSRPGFGFIPVGTLPEHVRASSDGCIAVTTNTDSCDLSLLDVTTLYNMSTLVGDAGAASENVVRRLVPTIHGRPLDVRPRWIEFSDAENPSGQCSARSYHAWVALPGCNLVAELDLAAQGQSGNAEVVRALRLTADGAEVMSDAEVATLACPSECAGVADAATPAPSSGPLPSTLALESGTAGRLFIGSRASELISIVPIDRASGAIGTPRTLRLESGAEGVDVVRLSPRSQAGKFLYAVAHDRSVRVIDVDREKECETNPDPRALALAAKADADPEKTARRYGCLPLGDGATPTRNAFAQTPGIVLPNGALPRDVAFVHVSQPPPLDQSLVQQAASPSFLVGDYAWIISSNGQAVLVNIFDACPEPNQPPTSRVVSCNLATSEAALMKMRETMPEKKGGNSAFGCPDVIALDRLSHHIRNGNDRFFMTTGESDLHGPPRLSDSTNPTTVTQPTVIVSGVVSADGGVPGHPQPALVKQPLPAECLASTSESVHFVDPEHARNETWTLAWEGLLPRTVRTTGGWNNKQGWTDLGAQFCANDVRAGDKLYWTGCVSDSDCDSGSLNCVRDSAAPVSVTNGLCLRLSDAAACSVLLGSVRRYRILHARQDAVDTSGGLFDSLTLGEIYEPEFAEETTTCVNDGDCGGVHVAATDLSGATVRLSTRCLEDADGRKRCLRACDPNAGAADEPGRCGTDFQCAKSMLGDIRCLRAPLDEKLMSACLKEQQHYEVHAGDAFLVSGSQSGVFSYVEADANSHDCVVPSPRSEFVRLRQSRIPLSVTTCPAPLDASQPLMSTTGQGVPNVCSLSLPDSTWIHFENPLFNLAVKWPKGNNVPDEQLTMTFTTVGGSIPFGVAMHTRDSVAAAPRAVVTAPDGETIYVVDEGKQTTATGLRGQLLRFSSAAQSADSIFLVR